MRESTELAGGFDPALVSWGGPGLASDTFTLENGTAQISSLFTDVALHLYEDALVITEPAALVDYVLSGRVKLDGERRAAFANHVEREMERCGGVFRVTKESGLFEAVRG